MSLEVMYEKLQKEMWHGNESGWMAKTSVKK